MPVSQMIFFAVWLAVALLGGALLVFAWQRLLARRVRNDPK
jgi:hypothetical protein